MIIDYYGVHIQPRNVYGMFEAYISGHGFIKADTLNGIKQAINSRREPIATIQRFPAAVYIFECNDECVIASFGSVWTDSKNHIERAVPKRYKLYYARRRDSYFFRMHGRRYYLDEALKTSWGRQHEKSE